MTIRDRNFMPGCIIFNNMFATHRKKKIMWGGAEWGNLATVLHGARFTSPHKMKTEKQLLEKKIR